MCDNVPEKESERIAVRLRHEEVKRLKSSSKVFQCGQQLGTDSTNRITICNHSMDFFH